MLLLSNILQDVCVKVSRIKQLARKGIIIAAIAIIMKSRSCGDRCSSNCCHEPGCQSIASLVDAHVYSQQCTILCQKKTAFMHSHIHHLECKLTVFFECMLCHLSSSCVHVAAPTTGGVLYECIKLNNSLRLREHKGLKLGCDEIFWVLK